MKTFNIQAAKTHLSRIIEQVAEGEEVIIAKAGKPMVRLVPFEKQVAPRVPGLFTGKGWEADDCWTSDESAIEESVAGPMYHGAVEEAPPDEKA